MTSAYERANVRPSVQTLEEEEGSLAVTLTGERKNAILSLRDFLKKGKLISVCYQQTI